MIAAMGPDAMLPFPTAGSVYVGAFVAGLLGGVHCLGMCGGVSGAVTLALPQAVRSRPLRLLPFLLGYNLGRITTYTAAGAVSGYLGFLAGDFLAEYRAWTVLRLIAGGFMIAMGLYLAGWWHGLAAVERRGAWLWRHLRPLSRALMPPRTPAHALAAGLVWGWLPCGLVYSALLWSVAAGGALQGAGMMLAFGAGTLPVLLATGFAAGLLRTAVGTRARRWAGATVIVFGAWTIVATLAMNPAVGLGCLPPGNG